MKNIRSGLGIVLLLQLSIPQLVSAQAPTLTEILDSAIVRDYHFENKQLEIQSAKIDQQHLKDAYLPKVTASGKAAYLYSGFDLTSPAVSLPQLGTILPENENHYTLSSFFVNTGIDASVLIYSGGKVPNLKKAVAEKIHAETVMLEKDKQEIIAATLLAYDQLGLLKEVRKVLEESEKRLNESKRAADKAYSYGLITAYEQKKIELAQAQLNSKFKEYQGKRDLILMQLHMLTNIDIERLALLDKDLDVYPMADVGSSVSSRPELRALESAVLANQYKIKAASSWWKPKVAASTSLGYYGLLNGRLQSKDPMMLTGQKLDQDLQNLNLLPVFNVGIGFKWEIFDGRDGIHEVQKARLELKMAENNQKDAVEKLSLNLEKSKIEYNVSTEQLNVKLTARDIAQNGMNQASSEFKNGLIKSSQLLEAENDFQNASMEYIQAVFNQRRAAVELLRATGNLTETSFK